MEHKIDKRKLDEVNTWSELAEIIADRIEQNKFILSNQWNRKDFIAWFLEREGVGLRFDWRLVARAYIIWKDLRNEKDHFTVIVGKEGDGKTTLDLQLLSLVSPNMALGDVIFDMQHYISKLQWISKDYKKNKKNKIDQSVALDEGGISLFSRESLTLSNKLLAKTFMVQRFLNIHVGICIPHYWSLDKLIRSHRINTLIIIKKRGYYKCIVGKGIKKLNQIGGKDKDKELIAIPIPYGFFWEGNFRKEFPKNIDFKEYEKHKFTHIKSFLEDAKIEASTVKMIKVGRLELEFGIKRDTIIKQIVDGKIEGRKIGNQWFITNKAYEKLIMA